MNVIHWKYIALQQRIVLTSEWCCNNLRTFAGLWKGICLPSTKRSFEFADVRYWWIDIANCTRVHTKWMIKKRLFDDKYMISGWFIVMKWPKFTLNSERHFRDKTSIYSSLASIEGFSLTDSPFGVDRCAAISIVRWAMSKSSESWLQKSMFVAMVLS
jgi:hypothetical protein